MKTAKFELYELEMFCAEGHDATWEDIAMQVASQIDPRAQVEHIHTVYI